MEVLFLCSALLTGLGMLGAIELRERPDRSLQTVELAFGADVTAEAVEAMIACVAGLPSKAVVVIDTLADTSGIRYRLHGSPATIDSLRGLWRGILPGIRLERSQGTSPVEWSAGAVLRLRGDYPVLRQDANTEAVAALLGTLQPLGEHEAVLYRWILSPSTRSQLPEPSSLPQAKTGLPGLLSHQRPRTDHLRALRAKHSGPVVAGVGIVAVKTGHPKRAAHLISRVVAVARSRRGAYGGLVLRKRGPRQLARLLERRTLRGGDLYAPGELTGLVGLPVGAPQVAGLSLGTAPLLMASPRIPTTGRVLGVSNWPGQERSLAQPILGGLSHTLLAGPTGVGKSELIDSLAVQCVKAGRGLFLLDGKGDTAEAFLARIPDHRLGDVIFLDPGREGPVPGLRLFGRGTDHQLTADLVLGIFADLFKETWGPLSARWLRAGLLLLAHDSANSGLADLPFVFSSDSYRRRLVARLKDDVLARETWAVFERMGPAERAHQLAAPLQKVEELVGRRVVRSVIGQGGAAKLDMHDVLATRKIVVVSLNAGKLGSVAARLIGALAVFKFFEAIQARAAIAPEARTPFFAYIDEPGVLGDIPVPLEDIYALARGLGVGLLLGVQSVAKLTTELRAAAMTNASTLVAWRQNSADAKLLSSDLVGVEPEGLQNLGKFEAIMRIGLGPGDVAAPVSARTLPLPAATSDPDAIRRASAARYGTNPAEVDAALMRRHGKAQGKPEKPVGRLRRKP
jgi:hypothetical protein